MSNEQDMRIAYGELIGGVSGDMFVAALLDLGLPLAKLRAELKKIPTLKFELKASKKLVHSIRATQFQVICPKHEAPRSWQQIRALILRSKLNSEVKDIGLAIFTKLAQAEAKIHGVAVDKVHFHEVGATDSIVDIMAVAIGIKELTIDALHFSPIPLGHGVTRSQHGPLPVPGPATLELLKGLPTFGVDIEGETVTPTGAAIICALGEKFGSQPSMTIEKIGYGTGQKEFSNRPNLFRLSVGASNARLQHEEMLVMETNIDDMNPQYYDHIMDRLFAAGARDVFLAPVQMKKNRPATLLSVICEPAKRDELAAIILQETTSIGVRYYSVNRLILKREAKKIATRFGAVMVKIVTQPDGIQRATPEYDDLKRIAAAKHLPLKTIHDEVMRQFKK
ncbi:MAG: nickel pincer cofactor biosynthesis protein LarC [Deltaproteobacteria bacterium]|nr:nickel pincer cofactor biosynthesis protein LarC [Deltaproteobacteria bacterium]